MSGFKALNIEYDEESDSEIDDTKEIQIEDALKLYQTALRYHAQGPGSFEAAAKAYKELFSSEIFSYPESQTELRRIEIYGPIDYDNLDDAQEGLAVTVSTGFDAAPSTLPQILHLSHKNYAQFKLEALAARLDALQATFEEVLTDAQEALDHFVSALDKDESDVDLWKQTARVGELMDSQRITRFCLEAMLDGDDEGITSVLSLPGLEDGIAAERLQAVVASLNDSLSTFQISSSEEQRRALSKYLRHRLDPFNSLTSKAQALRVSNHHKSPILDPTIKVIGPLASWQALGEFVLAESKAESNADTYQRGPIYFSFDLSDSNGDVKMTTDAGNDVASHGLPITTSEDLPKTIATQFPGLDNGKPTVQLETVVNGVQNDTIDTITSAQSADSVTLPTRKRSGDTAGINDGGEEGRSRSKRIRARESIPDLGESKQALHEANIQWEYEQHLNEIQGADDWLFETVGALFERVGISCIETIKTVKCQLANEETTPDAVSTAIGTSEAKFSSVQEDFFAFLNNYSDLTVQGFLRRGDDFRVNLAKPSTDADPLTRTTDSEKKAFDLLPEDKLQLFLKQQSTRRLTLRELTVEFILAMTCPGKLGRDVETSAYETYLWPEKLKSVVVRVLVTFDVVVFEHLSQMCAALIVPTVKSVDEQTGLDADAIRHCLQNIFELHLDIFSLIRRPNSGVLPDTVTLQGDRLLHWFELTREVNNFSGTASMPYNDLQLRFLWATTFYMAVIQDASQDQTLAYMQDLRSEFEQANKTIDLRNNAIMPELSLETLDSAIAKLTTKDFFEKVAEMESSDPAALIETIEPLLETLNARAQTNSGDSDAAPIQSPVPSELIIFLENGGVDAVLKLWKRLLDAYIAIDYAPMALRILHRMIRLVLRQLENELYSKVAPEERQTAIMSVLRGLRMLVKQAFGIVQKHADAHACMDEADVQSAVRTLSDILRLLQILNVFEDPIRIGRNQPPSLANGNTATTFPKLCQSLHDMQLCVWIMLYKLLKEIVSSDAATFPNALEDRFDFLRTLHRNLGIRAICGGLNHAFIQLLSEEFFQMTHIESYDSEQAQVLYDLYGLNCFLNPSYELMEHHCSSDARLDKTVAMQTVDLLLAQAAKLPMKDLIKHTLKDAIDRVHGSLIRKKPTLTIQKNREVIRGFLRSPIKPVDLYQCLKGEGNQLDMLMVPSSDAVLASKGWYFLMGHIALTKFRSVKRTAPTSTEDVDIAIAFFMQELEFTTTNWETWFRLAQAYDTKIEESVVWSAEKLNNSMDDIVDLQRAAIHCFAMATALALRSADIDAVDTSSKMAELYAEFAMRLYSSSREPFSMKPFEQEASSKPLSKSTGMAHGKAFQPLSLPTCWKLAKVLFQRTLAMNPQQWSSHYMLGKCLWKMYCNSKQAPASTDAPLMKDVLKQLYNTIEALPGRKDLGGGKREPILEPHYKLVSIVNKLVLKGHLPLTQAKEALSHTSYSNGVEFPETLDGWYPYILKVVKNLRATDKSHWHHRFIVRSAQIIFDDPDRGDRHGRATDAKHELTQQLFTKTMVLQVWRPEAERPGRHFVYTARYTEFFVKVLEILKDRANLEMLARRGRRRQHDTFENIKIWLTIVMAWLNLLREHGSVQEGLETSTFSTITSEDFTARKEPLEQWMQSQEPGANITLDTLREAQELKKINQGLVKPAEIDDLIGDAYAVLYTTVGRQAQAEKELRVAQEKAAAPPAIAAPSPPPAQSNRMSLAHLMNTDGATDDSATEVKVEPTQEPEVAAPKKRIGINRREIRIAAEQCIQKSGATNKPAAVAESSRVTDLVRAERGLNIGETSVPTSAPASVHDDADDESSLSEFEDAVEELNDGGDELESSPVRTVFPDLSAEPRSEEIEDAEMQDAEEDVEEDVTAAEV